MAGRAQGRQSGSDSLDNSFLVRLPFFGVCGRAWQAGLAGAGCITLGVQLYVLYGFVNYNFGIALFLVSLPAWLWYQRYRSFFAFLAVTALTTATYLAHLVGIGALAVSIAVLTILDWWRGKRWRKEFALDLLPLVPPCLLYASLGHYRGDTHTIVWGPFDFEVEAYDGLSYYVQCPTYCSLLGRVRSRNSDLVVQRSQVGRRVRLLALGGLLLLLAVIFPAEQLFSGSDADARLIIPALAVTLLALAVAMPRFWARLAFILALVALSSHNRDTIHLEIGRCVN